jgi:hypothetical protein
LYAIVLLQLTVIIVGYRKLQAVMRFAVTEEQLIIGRVHVEVECKGGRGSATTTFNQDLAKPSTRRATFNFRRSTLRLFYNNYTIK